MPPNRNNVPQIVRRRNRAVATEPPEVMTRSKAMIVLVPAGIFDVARAFFEMFWFFGPALAWTLCTTGVNSVIGTTVANAGGQAVAGLCGAAAMVGGAAAAAPLEAFGVMMSMAVGFAGFLALGLLITIVNRRLFRAQATGLAWFIGSFAVSEIPFIGTIPAFTIAIYRLYRTQIRVEKAALKKWQEEQTVTQLQERNQEEAQRAQYQVAQQTQFIQQEATNDEMDQIRATNDEKYGGKKPQNERIIGQPVRRAEDSGTEEPQKKPSRIETEFDTLKDALSELNAKVDRTREENRKLIMARQIMLGGLANVNETDPVLQAARSRALLGQKVRSEENPNGFQFNNLREIPDRVREAA